MRLTYRAEIPDHDPEEVFAWHERPGALERLTPPWADVDVEEKEGGIRDGARVVLRVRQGPASFRWELRHQDFEKGRQFRDVQVHGPLRSWEHTHLFRPRPGGGTALEDRIELEAPLGLPVGPGFVRRELDRLFAFRYRRLPHDLARHAEFADRPRLTVAISGASGLIGTNLTHFLTTGGHRVLPMVRQERRIEGDAIYWNPYTGEIDAEGLAGRTRWCTSPAHPSPADGGPTSGRRSSWRAGSRAPTCWRARSRGSPGARRRSCAPRRWASTETVETSASTNPPAGRGTGSWPTSSRSGRRRAGRRSARGCGWSTCARAW